MKLLTKYIIKQFFHAFLYGLCAFLIIVIVSELFEQLNRWFAYHTPFLTACEYILFRVPEWIVQTMPVAILLAVLFSLGGLAKHNELIGMQSSGISITKIIRPLLITGIVFSIISLFINELIVPRANQKVEYIFKVKVKHQKIENYLKRRNFIFIGEEGRNYSIGYFNGKKRIMQDISIDKFKEGAILSKQIFAKYAKWNKDHWEFHNGLVREFDKNGREIISEKEFTKKTFYFKETLKDFCSPQKKTNEMTFLQLYNKIKRLKKAAIPTTKEEVLLHLKISFPFSCLIIMIIGIPFALMTAKRGRIAGFTISVILGFIYWGAISVGQALGENKVLPPILGAWFSNIIFGIFGIGLTLRIKH